MLGAVHRLLVRLLVPKRIRLYRVRHGAQVQSRCGTSATPLAVVPDTVPPSGTHLRGRKQHPIYGPGVIVAYRPLYSA